MRRRCEHPPFCYAYRRRGDYDASLESYQKALELNPHHRGALKYLGEADLELGDGQRTIETLERLAGVCRLQLSAGSTVRWRAYCLEGGKLENAIRVRR